MVIYHQRAAIKALSAQQPDEATEHLQAALRVRAADGRTHFLLARAARLAGRLDDMKRRLAAAADAGYPVAELEREQILARAQIGEVHRLEGDLGRMLMDPEVDQRLVSHAIVAGLMRINEASRALQILTAWEQDYPDDPIPHYLRAKYLVHENFFAEAADSYREAIARDSKHFDARLGLADALREVSENEAAIAEYEVCLEDRPGHVEAMVGLAASLIDSGRTDEARELLRAALKRNPEHVNAQLDLAELLLTDGDTDSAIQLLESVLQAQPFNPAARYNYATALSLAGRPEDAREQFDYVDAQTRAQAELRNLMEQLSGDPGLMDVRAQVGQTLLNYGDPREGALWLENSLQFDPDHEATHRLLAEYYEGIGERALAQQHREWRTIEN